MLVNEIVNEQNTKNFNEFMREFDGLEYQKNFSTNETVERPLHVDGLISTYDLLNELEAHSTETVFNVEEFLQEYGDLEIVSDKYDNTYNYAGYLDNYMEFSMFELENDQTLATVSVCLGLDPRSAYTKKVAFIYDDEYDFLETLANNYELMEIEFTADGKKYRSMFDGSALSEYGRLDITDLENHEIIYDDEISLDTRDSEEITSTLAELMKTEKINVDKIDYFCYAG